MNKQRAKTHHTEIRGRLLDQSKHQPAVQFFVGLLNTTYKYV